MELEEVGGGDGRDWSLDSNVLPVSSRVFFSFFFLVSGIVKICVIICNPPRIVVDLPISFSLVCFRVFQGETLLPTT